MSFSFNAPPFTISTTPLSVNMGGTGLSTIPTNSLLAGNLTSSVSTIAPSANSILQSNGSSISSFSQILPTAVQNNINYNNITSGLISVANGGTGLSTIPTNAILFGNGTGVVNTVSLTNNNILGCSAFTSTPIALTVLPTPIQQGITNLGTITSGVWNGTVVTSANLDSSLSSKTLSGCTTSGTTSLAGTLNVPTTIASQLLQTDASKNIVSMGTTLPSNVQDNITRLGTIATVASPISSTMLANSLDSKTMTNTSLTNPTITSLVGSIGGASILATLSAGQFITRDLTTGVNRIRCNEGGTSLDCSTASNGALLIGNTSGFTLSTLTGTTNQVAITNGAGSVTLSTPQSIGTSSAPTFASETLSAVTNQLVLGTINTATISSTAPSASRTYTIADPGNNANFVMSEGTQTINGSKTFGSTIIGSVNGNSANVTGIVSISNGGTSLNSSTASNGQLLIGNGSGFTLSTLTSGSNIIITNTGGSITITGTASTAILYRTIASKTGICSNTTSQVSMLTSTSGVGSLTIAANTLIAGDVLHWKISGYMSTGTSGSNVGNIYAYLGATQLAFTGGFTPVSKTNTNWYAEGDIVIQTTGVSGVTIGTMIHHIVDTASGGTHVCDHAASTVDTTVSKIFDIQYNYSIAAALNTCSITKFLLWKN